MKIVTYSYPHSSFLSMEKDMGIIVDMIMKNNNLKKMLHYPSKDCLSCPSLSEEESLALFENNIKIVPKFKIDGSVFTYIAISFDNFTLNTTNPEFRDNTIIFDIICHFDQWQMADFQLRPYRIAAELDSMFNNKHLSGIGTLQFLGASQMLLTDEYAGVCLMYQAVHGEEDKKTMPNPNDELSLVENFNQIFNEE